MAERISRDELRQLIREALREALGDAGSFSSPLRGEAESARSAEPGEGAALQDQVRPPHPVASQLDLSPEGRGGRASSLAAGVLTEALVTKLAAGHHKILIGGEVVVTPLARERARMLKVEIVRQQP